MRLRLARLPENVLSHGAIARLIVLANPIAPAPWPSCQRRRDWRLTNFSEVAAKRFFRLPPSKISRARSSPSVIGAGSGRSNTTLWGGARQLRPLDDRPPHPRRAGFRAGWALLRSSCTSTGCRRAAGFGFHGTCEGPRAADGLRSEE